jgi:tetratricopeptide (TPR) repeat protein
MKFSQFLLTVIGVSFFLLANIASSGLYPPLFSSLVLTNSQKLPVKYLADIKKTPEFNNQIKYFDQKYNYNFINLVEQPEKDINFKISQLESILEKNEDAVDVLLALSTIYKDLGNAQKSKMYLSRAREIDPSISKSAVK